MRISFQEQAHHLVNILQKNKFINDLGPITQLLAVCCWSIVSFENTWKLCMLVALSKLNALDGAATCRVV